MENVLWYSSQNLPGMDDGFPDPDAAADAAIVARKRKERPVTLFFVAVDRRPASASGRRVPPYHEESTVAVRLHNGSVTAQPVETEANRRRFFPAIPRNEKAAAGRGFFKFA